MPIHISSLSSRNLKSIGKSGQTQKSGQAKGGGGATATSRTDSFDMTGNAGRLLELEGRIANMPIVDAQKVEAVQQALANGSFTIDPQSAAEKMLAMELSLP
ncbi:MAG: flagellar biosynthesis anti-sigma factor FlgM [Candidatus Thiodiazotropha sp.]